MNLKIIKRLLKECVPFYKYLIILIFLAIISVFLSLITPLLFGQAIDLLIGKNQVKIDLLLKKIFEVSIIILCGTLSQNLLTKVVNKITYGITSDLRNKLFVKIQKLPLKYLDSNLHGNLMGRVINDVDYIGMGLLQSFTSLFTGISTIIGIIIIMFTINIQIAMIVIGLTPISLLVAGVIVKKTHIYFKEQLELRGELSGYVEEMIGNQKLVKAFNYEERNKIKFEEINERMHSSGVRSQFFGALINPTTRVVNGFVYAVVGILGAINVVNGNFSVGMLSSFLNYANQYTKPFNDISAVMSEMQAAVAAAERVFELLDQEEESPSRDNKVVGENIGEVILKDISFSYQEDTPLIEHLNINAKPGQKIAIVGKTGCGKTTLINLLMRFYNQNEGDILIDGVNTLDMKRNYLRSLYGMVLQESWLFKGTIKENIAYGKTDASEAEIIDAATKASAHKFIMQLENGYDTVIEEDGSNISQGEKQLICIARIMLIKPPMLILDEATSSIDTRTELKIQKAFDLLMEGRTTFIVAHRLSTIKTADQILVMDKGKVVEQGTHKELLQKQGFYYKQYYSQFDV